MIFLFLFVFAINAIEMNATDAAALTIIIKNLNCSFCTDPFIADCCETVEFCGCNSAGRVTHLRTWLGGTNGNRLYNGFLSSEIGVLRAMKKIDVAHAATSVQPMSALPTELSLLSNVFYLHIDQNRWRGSLNVQHWTELAYLDLGWTGIEIEYHHLLNKPKLRHVTVGYPLERRGGTLPSQIGAVSLLTRLHLQRQGFRGTVPTEWTQLKSLIDVNLAHNFLTGSIPQSLTTINECVLDNNCFEACNNTCCQVERDAEDCIFKTISTSTLSTSTTSTTSTTKQESTSTTTLPFFTNPIINQSTAANVVMVNATSNVSTTPSTLPPTLAIVGGIVLFCCILLLCGACLFARRKSKENAKAAAFTTTAGGMHEFQSVRTAENQYQVLPAPASEDAYAAGNIPDPDPDGNQLLYGILNT